MTSARNVKANRANARASTGAKTWQGKMRSARNARRHGLSVSVLTNPLLSEEAEHLAHKIAGEGAPLTVLEAARRAAEAQIELVRIRKARHDLFVRRFEDLEFSPKTSANVAKQRLEILERLARLRKSPMLSKMKKALINQPEGPKKIVAIVAEISNE